MTKDELIAELAKSQAKIDKLETEDENKRWKLSHMLEKYLVTKKQYGDDVKSPLDWERIHFNLGKIMERKQQLELERSHELLKDTVQNLSNDFYHFCNNYKDENR